MFRPIHRVLKRAAFGNTQLPRQFTIGIVFEPERPSPSADDQVSFQFIERHGKHRLLREIRLRGSSPWRFNNIQIAPAA